MANIYILLTDQNILNVIAAKYYHKHDVIILKNPRFIANYSESGLIEYLRKEGRTVQQQTFDPYDPQNLLNLKGRVSGADVVVIPSGGYAYALNMASLLKDACTLCYIEVDGDIFIENNGIFEELKQDDMELDVEDFIENFGGNISTSSENFFDEPTSIKAFDLIKDNLELYQSMMRPIPIKSHFHDKNKVFINLKTFEEKPQAKEFMDKLLTLLSKAGKCDVKTKADEYVVYFHDKDYKEFFSKSGTWLEAITYRALAQIKSVESPMSSVKFYWKTGQGRVINEIDVMGVHDNNLVLISCKDTKSHTETTLYELFTHGEQLGFDSIKKILVTTSAPLEAFRNRAEDLGVSIVLYDGTDPSIDSIKTLSDALGKAILS